MSINFIHSDITQLDVDCIVNAANKTLLGGGGVDGQIHKMAGRGLLGECKKLGGCETGEAKITKGYNLKSKYVIHTVGPIYQDGKQGESKLLENCYINSLILAKENKIKTIAFPLISAGAYGYPKKEAIKVAIKGMTKFENKYPDCNIKIYLVFYGDSKEELKQKFNKKIDKYIENNFAKRNIFKIYDLSSKLVDKKSSKISKLKANIPIVLYKNSITKEISKNKKPTLLKKDKELEALLKNIESSFNDTLLKIIDKKGLKDSEVYNKANIDRKLFSKIRNGSHPKKTTAVALCIALHLSLNETSNLLNKAGYALTSSSKFDIIIKYFIEHRKYNIYEINEALFLYDELQLGVN